MSIFENVEIIPYYPDSVFIQWDLKSEYVNDDRFFYIYYSGTEMADPQDWIKLSATPVVNQCCALVPFSLLEKYEFVWFGIKMVRGNQTSYSNLYGFTGKLNRKYYLIAKELIRKKELYRKKVVGVSCAIYKQKRFGHNCRACTDRHTGHQKNSSCIRCYGTRIVGGFELAFENFMELPDSLHEKTSSEIGMLENKISVGKLTLPLVQKGDIILEKSRRALWYVNKAERELIQNFTVDQHLDVRRVSPSDVEYKFIF